MPFDSMVLRNFGSKSHLSWRNTDIGGLIIRSLFVYFFDIVNNFSRILLNFSFLLNNFTHLSCVKKIVFA